MAKKISTLLSIIFSLYLTSLASAGELTEHSVFSDGHGLTLWERDVETPIGTILLLHGRTYSSLPDFDLEVEGENLSLMQGLNARGFRTYALDARGYGATPRDASGWHTPSKAANDVVAVLNWIRNEHPDTKVFVYGWSYGTMVAQLVAQRQPELIDALVLFGYPFNPERHVVGADVEYPVNPPRKPNTPEHAASDFITPGSISQKAIDAYVKVALKWDPVRVDFKDMHEWEELDATKVTVPTLLMQGEFDPLTPTEQQAAFFTRLGTTAKWWVVLDGGDHAALLETPRIEMMDAITTFLKANSP